MRLYDDDDDDRVKKLWLHITGWWQENGARREKLFRVGKHDFGINRSFSSEKFKVFHRQIPEKADGATRMHADVLIEFSSGLKFQKLHEHYIELPKSENRKKNFFPTRDDEEKWKEKNHSNPTFNFHWNCGRTHRASLMWFSLSLSLFPSHHSWTRVSCLLWICTNHRYEMYV